MLMHSVWFGERWIMQVLLVWTCLMMYDPVNMGCSLSENDKMVFSGLVCQSNNRVRFVWRFPSICVC